MVIGKEITAKNNKLPCQEIELFGIKDNLYPLSICSVITINKIPFYEKNCSDYDIFNNQ
jgi:hypothetical protein